MNRITRLEIIGSLVVASAVPAQGQSSTDSLKASIDSLRAQVAAMREALDSVSDRVRVGSVVSGTITLNGDVIFRGRVCITNTAGTCHPDATARLQLLSGTDANILFVSNLKGAQYQGAAAHTNELSGDSDGGFRAKQNAYLSTILTPAHDPSNDMHYMSAMRKGETNRPGLTYGPDRSGGFSFSWDDPGYTHEYTQHLVINRTPSTKEITFGAYMSGWKIVFNGSTSAPVQLDRRWVVPF